MFKRLLSFALSICLICSCFVLTDEMFVKTEAATNDYGLVDNVQDGQILQCWGWSYQNIAANMEKIASQGFSAIQTSPVQSNKESTTEYYSTFGNSCWVFYQPISFTMEQNSYNALGTKSDFEYMCEVAHEYGIKVIADIVLNHMANDMTENTIHPSIPSDLKDNSDCWHDISKNCGNWSDRYDITQYCLSGLPDLNTANSTVQWHCTNILKECIEAGADGFRFDAVKHIETPYDTYCASDFWPNVLGAATEYAQSTRGFTPYYYGELLDDPGDGNIGAYTEYMSVTDNRGSSSIRENVVSKNASAAANSAIFNGAMPYKTVQWTESHDTHKDGGTNFVSEHDINKTWAIVGSRDEVCGMYLARPSDMSTTMLGSADWTSWTYPEVKAVNQFKNVMVGEPEYFASSGSVAYVERGTKGAVLVNVGGTYYNGMSVPAHTIASGTYTDQVTGNTFTVSNGTISGDIGDTGIAVIYDSSDVSTPTTSTTPAETLSGETKTVYVGIIEYMTEVPTLHYWNDEGLEGDVELTAVNEVRQYCVGDEYWSNEAQNFNIYKAQIPVEATKYKTYTASTDSDWAEEKVTYVEGEIALVFEWNGSYHNLTVDYSAVAPTETDAPTDEPTIDEPTKATTLEPSKELTEAPSQSNTEVNVSPGYYLVGTLNGEDCWDVTTLTEDRKLQANDNNAGEYMLGYTFTEGDQIKVINFDGTAVTRWYNNGGENFVIDSTNAGEGTLYFRPEGDSNWSYYYFTVFADAVEEPSDAPIDEPTDEPSQANDTLAVTVNGVTTNVKVGDTFTYTYTLSGMKLLCVEAAVNYDSDFLSVSTVDESDEDAYTEFMKSTFPAIYSSAVCNTDLTDSILYNSATVNGVNFTNERVLATFEFTALAGGETIIDTDIIEMADSSGNYYVDKTPEGSVIVKDWTYGEYITYEQSTEPTTPQTEPETEPTEPTEPETEPTEPATEPTEPETEPTEPETEPTEEPTEPAVLKVQNITIEPSVATVIVSWDALEGATRYYVYKNDGAGNWVIQKGTNTTSQVIKGLEGNTTYEFKVIAEVVVDGKTIYLPLEKADIATCTTNAPIATGSISATADDLTATITWEPIEGAERYWVYRSTVGADGPYYIHVSTDTNSYVDKKLRPDTTYYYRVMALTKENGVDCYSDPYDSPVTSATTGSASIIQVASTASTANTVTISWPKYLNADKYWVMSATTRADIVDNKKSTVWASLTDTTYTFKGLDANSVYYFNVCARYIDEETGKEEFIYYMPVIVRTAYTDDEFITFTPVDDSTVTLTWPEEIEGINTTWVNVYNAQGTKVNVVKTTTNTVTITGLSDYKNCSYELQVLDTNGTFGTLTKSGGEHYHE